MWLLVNTVLTVQYINNLNPNRLMTGSGLNIVEFVSPDCGLHYATGGEEGDE